MKQLDRRVKNLEARFPIFSKDPFSRVFALSFSRLSDDHLERTAEVLQLLESGKDKTLTDAQEVAWNQWEAELARAAEELQCTAQMRATGWEARA